ENAIKTPPCLPLLLQSTINNSSAEAHKLLLYYEKSSKTLVLQKNSICHETCWLWHQMSHFTISPRITKESIHALQELVEELKLSGLLPMKNSIRGMELCRLFFLQSVFKLLVFADKPFSFLLQFPKITVLNRMCHLHV